MTFVLGLTGSIGMGKSATAATLRRLGVPVHDADAAVHALYRGRAVPLVAAAFPGTVREGAVDRAALGAAVLNDPDRLRRLEAIVHPLVRDEEEAFLRQALAAGAPLVVLDIPLLFETGHDHDFDRVIVAACDPQQQLRRLMQRDSLSEAEARARLNAQWPIEEKVARADYVIRTDGTVADTDSQVRTVYEMLNAEC
jgi:dephospho-CoA kinase